MYLSMVPTTTLNMIGETTINRHCTSNSGTCFTVSITISTNGNKLKPYMIFKSTLNRRIAQREFPAKLNHDRVVLCCQKKA
jgi:hypothetical protein